MLHRQQYAPLSVRSLANHLHAASAACEDLLKLQGPAADPHNLLRLELTAIAHVLQAREDMKELQFADSAVASQIALFLAVTGCLEDATPPRAPAASLEAAANRLIAGRIPVATLLALAAAMLGVLELCCASMDADTRYDQPPPPVAEALVWATGPDGA